MFRKALLLGATMFVTPVLAAATPAVSPVPNADSVTTGSVTVGGTAIPYHAVAGTILVHGSNYNDSAEVISSRGTKIDTSKDEDAKNPPVASMFYTAYFKQGVPSNKRPITFIYNGGPGSASVWLHMGSFGPVRVNTPGDQHLAAAPYPLINNPQSLMDVSDVVFIDAPGTGFSRIAGKDAGKEFLGVDGDAEAFTHFIAQFLAKYHRYNSPKYLFGESYGTMRSAVVINNLEQDESIDFNGVILLSQILNYDNSDDGPQFNAGMDAPYILALPTYAATAWYHHCLPQQHPDLKAFLKEVEQFASTDYTLALQQGADLPEAKKQEIANRLHDYTGLPVDYILRADLRVNGGEFDQQLQAKTGNATGRLDTRFSSPTIDPMSQEVDYDPQSTAISSAYVSTFNEYVRSTLKYGTDENYRLSNPQGHWDSHHRQPGGGYQPKGVPNVMTDLAMAIKTNPNLHVMLNAGYFDLATPYYEGIYEMKHLPIPANLQKNIEYAQYQSGHMVYVDPNTLQQLHDNVAAFIRKTDNLH
ncbi:S10 family peptidase [Gluconobacter wancherniae]|uniref:Peptidase S10 n=1 Tax=Gluconobacter wancherniae NBRC 103581 TaxID=656744 RepID=A0A511B6T8_9PROT|nr:peptidase S10 [Gluconobacter wancherniae]MBF0853664.1 peptidase S10 [Gluconobacter wancherniae]MBS1088957.1 peptidase S10 [Gluconobacter wancherniae]GBD55591.1 peptidase S1 [Gluconobacter wancherniae NBRC 103581]GBR66484.1 carboxypeptidase-like protein [Gluconobacter wancherniae NBRC 103581]GEK93507.1 peptidase S10 [Gluconobacter wancherniae NBRC 103581]